jgi:aryl-alcohol dehydrogenase-like predicted oxidoreductase
VVIATKVYSRVGPGPNDIGASRGNIMDAVEASLRRLQTDHIDLYQIHGNDAVTPVEETLRALDTLMQQGKVRYIGGSNWQAWKLAKALGTCEFRSLARFDTSLLLDRRPRSRTGNRSPAAIRKGRPARMESACRWLAVRQVQPGEPEARRFAPH